MSASVSEPSERLRWVPWLVAGVALWPISEFLLDAWRAVTFPYPLDYGEGPLLDQARRLAALDNIYRPLESGPPWTVSNYPPVYPLLLAVGTALVGPIYAWGRVVSILSALAVAWWIGRILHRRTGDALVAAVSAVTFLFTPYVAFWATLQRVDLLALALSWAAIAWLLGDARRSVAPAAMLLAASILTRQTFALAAPCALFVWLLLQDLPGRALRLALLTGGLVGFAAVVLQILSGGFVDHVLTANWNVWRPGTLVEFAVDVCRRLPVPILGATLAIALLLRRWRRREPSWDFGAFVSVYLLFALLSAVTIGKAGANVNYLLELSVALSLGMGILLAELRREPRLRLLALGFVAVQWFTWVQPTRHEMFTEIYLQAENEAAAVLERIERTDGDIVAGQWLGLLPLADRDVTLQPHERQHLVTHGHWDQKPAVDWLRRGEAEMILLYRPPEIAELWQGMWTQELRKAIEECYAVEEFIGSTQVLRPRTCDSIPVSESRMR
ncbi:MAG: hypothetical protein MPN21_01205 [Thermoanaerobaculia bacterium]|nr:hypothetical protein [Thermoanaerobaculia bacterium]